MSDSFLGFCRRPRTDDEVIARARKLVSQEDRWGRWGGTFFTVLGIAGIGAFIWGLWVIQRMINNNFLNQAAGPLWGGFVFGIIIGTMILYLAHHVASLFSTGVSMFRGSLETERLLLRYHDALRMMAADLIEKGSSAAGDNGTPE